VALAGKNQGGTITVEMAQDHAVVAQDGGVVQREADSCKDVCEIFLMCGFGVQRLEPMVMSSGSSPATVAGLEPLLITIGSSR
ncbi:MAG: hypothetical protein PF483_07015, partial [Halothiobacillus sp.]|nr:hypothetical protein [Halothiobacillus sp.]